MKIITAAILLLLISCKKESIKVIESKKEPFEAVAAPPESINIDTNFVKPYKAILANNDFPELSLTETDIANVDKLLFESVKAYNKKKSANKQKSLINLRYYALQYIPQLNKKGEKEVAIHGACSILDDERWKKERIYVKDGGKCYFTVIVNLDKDTFDELHTNGMA